MREDTVAQAVSWVRAEQTDFWQRGETASPRRRPSFDFGQIDTCVRTIHEHNRAWRQWFAALDVHPHQVVYEELAADMIGVTRGILHALGLGAAGERSIASRQQRQADEINQDWINRYRAELTRPGPA